MPASCVERIFDRFGYDFHLCVVIEAHSEAVESLLQLPKAVHLHPVLVESYTTVLADLGCIGVLVRRTHLQKDSDLVSNSKWIAPVDHFSSVNDGPVRTSVGDTLGPADGEGGVEGIDAKSQPNCGVMGNFFFFPFVLLQDIVHEKCALQDRTLEIGTGMPKAAAYSGWTGDGDIWRLFEYFLERNWK